VLLLLELPVLYPQPFAESDALLHWFVGHLVVEGGSPYDAAAWAAAGARFGGTIAFWGAAEPGLAWPYPPWTAWLLAPFGAFPPLLGSWILVLTFCAAGIAAAVIAVRSLPLSAGGRTFALVLALSSQPFIYAVNSGQLGPLLGLGSALLLLPPTRVRSGLPAFVLLLAKPQVTAVLLAAAAVDVIRASLRRAALIGGAIVALAALSAIRFPDVFALTGTGLGGRVANQLRVSSSSWSLAAALAGDWWPLVGGLLVLVAVGCWRAAVRWAPPAHRRAVMLAGAGIVSLAAAPVVRSYDQALLLPAVAVLVLLGEGLVGRARLLQRLALMFTIVVLPWVLFVSAQLANSPPRIGVVPLAFAVTLLGSALAVRPSPRLRGDLRESAEDERR
jgi:hypothetical protein